MFIIVLSSRTTWVALSIITFLMFLDNFGIKKIIYPVCFLFLFIFSLYYFNSILPNYFVYQYEILLERLFFIFDLENVVHLGSRLLRWDMSLKYLEGNFTGLGFSFFDTNTGGLKTPHNEVLGIGIGSGYLGLSLMILIYVYYFKSIKIIRIQEKDEYFGYFFNYFFIYILMIGLTENYSFGMQFSPYIWIIFGIISSYRTRQKYIL